VIVVGVLLVWVWGWGYFAHDGRGADLVAAPFWPVLVPVGLAYHRWRWGPRDHDAISDFGRKRYVYSNTRWWQRGERERRAT
jgi:hypothetical protein